MDLELFLTIGIAELLIDHGADLYSKDKDNKTLLDIATSEKCKIYEQNFK